MIEKDVEYNLLGYCEEVNGIIYNKEIKNVTQILNYMKVCLEKLNQKELEKTGEIIFSTNEFDFITDKLLTLKNSVESFKVLNDKLELKRDNGKIAYIKLIKPLQGDKNENNITSIRQVYVECNKEHKNIFDVVILVNGIPIIHIENKNIDKDIGDAYKQIKRYKRENCYSGLFSNIQILGITNDNDTQYAINNEIITPTSFKHWNDNKDNIISKLEKFAFFFLNKNNIIELLTRFSFIDRKEISGKIEENIIIANSHQINATKAILKELENKDEGYIYHNMGAGKTYTSYFVIKNLQRTGKYKKIIFCTDRIDLDNQTQSVFKNASLNAVYINDTDTLVKTLESPNTDIIISTMQKLNNAVKRIKNKSIRTDSIALLFDECHRSQAGYMRKNIRKYFKNIKLIGFSGTPRTIENPDIADNTTTDYFGRCVHKYNMYTSIKNNTTLPLNLNRYAWIKGSKKLVNKTKLVKGINTEEVYDSPQKIKAVCKEILQNYKQITLEKKYSSILTVDKISTALTYFKTFKELENENSDFKYAVVFSWGKGEDLADKEEVDNKDIELLLKHYNDMFKTNFNINMPNAYRADIMNRLKSYEENNLDMVIVVNMLLTGFDAPRVNTILIDRTMQAIDLMQAVQRTTRIADEDKVYGNIFFFRNNDKELKKALRLYCGDGNLDGVIVKEYQYILKDFKNALKILIEMGDPSKIALLTDEKKKLDFINRMRAVKIIFNSIKGNVDFKWDDLQDVPITRDEFDGYYGQFRRMFREFMEGKKKGAVSIIEDVDFEIKAKDPILLNYEYIKKYLINIGKRKNLTEENKRKIKELAEGLPKAEKELVENFIDSENPDNTFLKTEKNNINAKFNKLKTELKILSQKDIEKIIKIYIEQCQYDFSQEMDTNTRAEIRNIISNKEDADSLIKRTIFDMAPIKIQEYCKETKN